MNTDQLEALCVSVEAGSLSGAARRLGVSQPTITRRLQGLESELGTSLLRAGAGGVVLTPAGERVVAFGQGVLAELAGLRESLGSEQGSLRGSIRIAASTIPGEHLVPRAVAGFLDLHPGVEAEVEVVDSDGVARRLLAGAADVGFTGHESSHESLAHVPVAEDEVVLAVADDHPLAAEGEVDPGALAGERLVQREQGSGTQQVFARALAVEGLSLPPARATLRLGSTHAVLEAVRAGAGVGLVSLRALEHGGAGVAVLRLRGLSITRKLYCAYATNRLRLPQHEAFIAYATRQASV